MLALIDVGNRRWLSWMEESENATFHSQIVEMQGRRGNKVKMQLQKCFSAAPAADDRHYEAKLLCW